MRILWLINIPLPEASILMQREVSPYGGWLINASNKLSKNEKVKLSIAFPDKKIKRFERIEGNIISYYPFEEINKKKDIDNNTILKDIVEDIKPDIVHIYGTELPHSVAMVNVCNELNIKTVISIQGLVSIIEKHMYSGLPLFAIYGRTLRNLIRKDNVSGLKKIFVNRGKNEIIALERTKNIIGRTTWDKACSLQVNSNINYFHCNETLREEFYKYQWDLNKCERYSIFLSQAQYPIKGLHFVLQALPLIITKYPKTKVYISGKNITKSDSIKDKLLMTYYGKYIRKIIKKLDLEGNIIFTGPLDEDKMCQMFLNSHVFVSPSTIENESNSLSESKILGVPSIASYVGGVIDRVHHNIDGFHYQHDAPYMLAHYVCQIFENDSLALKFSSKAREYALQTHDRDENTRRLIEIYTKICDKK